MVVGILSTFVFGKACGIDTLAIATHVHRLEGSRCCQNRTRFFSDNLRRTYIIIKIGTKPNMHSYGGLMDSHVRCTGPYHIFQPGTSTIMYNYSDTAIIRTLIIGTLDYP